MPCIVHARCARRLPAAFLLCTAGIALTAPQPGRAGELADAVMRGDGARIDALLDRGTDIDARQNDGATALHWAVYREDLETTRRLLRAGADPNATTELGMKPLIAAAETGNAAILRQLLEAGANVDQPLPNGETALMMASRTGSVDAIELLIDHGAQVNARESLRGTTALMWAAAEANAAAVRALTAHGADVNARSAVVERGRRPYLAPPARERIREFVEGTGLRGAAVDFDLDATESGEDTAAEIAAARRAAATRVLAAEPAVPEPGRPGGDNDWGGLTPLIFAAREGDRESAEILIAAGADVNGTSAYGWTPLLTATHNRYYQLGLALLEHGADPNIANRGGWTPLYIATDNRNIEGGDYPTRRPDVDHLVYIERLLDAGADPNLRMASSTETRTVFTQQWLYEDGATPFLRAAQSGDLTLLRLLLEHGAVPDITTVHGVTPLMAAAGIGWVEGVTHEWSPAQTYATVELLLALGADVNARDALDGRTALMGAAHKGRPDIVQLLVDHGADLGIRDIGSRDSTHVLAGKTWQALDYAEGLVRVGVQSATPQPETAALIRRLMRERGLPVPPEGRTLDSICVTALCD